MATKLGKNFGLGNSYKNVKLVKSAVRKVDSEVDDKVSTEQFEQAIQELKNGTLPVYVVNTSDSVIEFFENNYPAPYLLIIKYQNGFSMYTINDLNYNTPDLTCTFIGYDLPTGGLIQYYTESIDISDLTFSDLDDTIDMEGDSYCLSKNAGSKLYRHSITFTDDNTSDEIHLEIISTYDTPTINREGCFQGLVCVVNAEDADDSSELYNGYHIGIDSSNYFYICGINMSASPVILTMTAGESDWEDSVTPL